MPNGKPGKPSRGLIGAAKQQVAQGQSKSPVGKLLKEIASQSRQGGRKGPASPKAKPKPAARFSGGNAAPRRVDVQFAVQHAKSEAASERQFNRACASAANGILNPIGGPTHRNPKFSNRPVAAARLHEQGQVTFATGSDQLLNAKNSFIALYNDPRRLHREYTKFSTATHYTWQFSNADGEPVNFIPNSAEAGITIKPYGAQRAGGAAIHGEKLVAGVDETGVQGIWIAPVGHGAAKIYLEGGWPANVTLNFTLWKRRNGVWASQDMTVNIVGAPGAQVVQLAEITEMAHYTISPLDDASATALQGATIFTAYESDGGDATTIGQHMAPEFDDHKVNVDTAAIVAHSVLLSNTSELVAKNGSWYAIQVSGKKELDEFIPSDPAVDMTDIIGDMQNVAYDTAEEGIHAPRVPPAADDFIEVDCSGCDSEDDFLPPYMIDDPREYVMVEFSILTEAGRSFHKLHYSHINFKTTSLWYQLSPADLTVEELNAVLKKLGSMGPNSQFTRNKNHLPSIMKWIKNTFLPVASSAATSLAPMFGAYGPAVRAAGMLGSAISNL